MGRDLKPTPLIAVGVVNYPNIFEDFISGGVYATITLPALFCPLLVVAF
jgi:hypothetical protein